jgi:hypothetical protein
LRALFAYESGLSEPEVGLEHVFVLLIWQKKHRARLQKHLGTCYPRLGTFYSRLGTCYPRHFHWTHAISIDSRPAPYRLSPLSFDLIRESASRAFGFDLYYPLFQIWTKLHWKQTKLYSGNLKQRNVIHYWLCWTLVTLKSLRPDNNID